MVSHCSGAACFHAAAERDGLQSAAVVRILVRAQTAALEQDGFRAGAGSLDEVVAGAGPAAREQVCSRGAAAAQVLPAEPGRVGSRDGLRAPVSEERQVGWRESRPELVSQRAPVWERAVTRRLAALWLSASTQVGLRAGIRSQDGWLGLAAW